MHSFWQMAWENGTKIIVMLTRVQEGDRVKCLQYWPEGPPGSTEIYGDFEVKTVKEVDHESYVLKLIRNKVRPILTQSWDIKVHSPNTSTQTEEPQGRRSCCASVCFGCHKQRESKRITVVFLQVYFHGVAR